MLDRVFMRFVTVGNRDWVIFWFFEEKIDFLGLGEFGE